MISSAGGTVTESTSAVVLADMILHDYGLTQKLLRMVNTLGYSQYGEVTTVTRGPGRLARVRVAGPHRAA
ncbi:MAG: hypothetical protein WCJ30_15190, partial [Deltaproteobacteria bacterium]